MNTYDLILIILCFVSSVGLAVVAYFTEKYRWGFWKYLYLIPLALTLLFLSVSGLDVCFIPLGIGVFFAVIGFLYDEKGKRYLGSAVLFAATLVTLLMILFYPGYRLVRYDENFDRAIAELEEKYVLTEHKNIDFTALRDKYYPQFRKATKNRDKAMNAVLWWEFAAEFNDGHVGYVTADTEASDAANAILFGNDFGFATLKLDDGSFVAVSVDEGKVPFANGTEILAIDGTPLSEIAANVTAPLITSPVSENAEFYNSILAGGNANDEITVSYVDESGAAKEVKLAKCGRYFDRANMALEDIDTGANVGTLLFEKIDEKTVLYRVKQMMQDAKTYGNSNYSDLKNIFTAGLEQYKAEGCDTLVIDLRGNGGGDPFMTLAFASAIAPEGEHYYCSTGVIDDETLEFVKDENGRYVIGESLTYTGENLWDGDIIVLTNGRCVSAGDHFIKLVKDYPNVTVGGFTSSNSSGQAVSTIMIDDDSELSYSAVPAMYEDGSPFVDADADGNTGVGFDVKVPLDKEAVSALYDEGRDYVLEYMLNYVK